MPCSRPHHIYIFVMCTSFCDVYPFFVSCTLFSLCVSSYLSGTTSSSSGSKSKDKAVGIKGGSSSNCNSFTVRFSYLPALGIIAVCPQSPCPSSLLANLFPNDMGKDTPNPANHHGRAARASVVGVFEYPVDVLCRPYKWAQWLAGLHFSPTAGGAADNGSDMAAALNYPIEPSTRAVVAALRSRVRTHAALEVQLKIFASKGPLPVLGLQDQMNEAASNIELRRCAGQVGFFLQFFACVARIDRGGKLLNCVPCWLVSCSSFYMT